MDKILTRHPEKGKSGRNIRRETYKFLKKAIIACLCAGGGEIFCLLVLSGSFLDLEARPAQSRVLGAESLADLFDNARGKPLPDGFVIHGSFRPAPPQKQESPEILEGLVAEEVLKSVISLSRESDFQGFKYFESLPSKPKIQVVFTQGGTSVGSLPGPARLRAASYSPQEGDKGGRPPLVAVELRLDREFFARLSRDAFSSKYPFSSLQEKARRLAWMLVPGAVADLELARLMDQSELPNYLRVEALEELRFAYETAAVRKQVQAGVSFLEQSSFEFFPAEYEYLDQRLTLSNLLDPNEPRLKKRASELWAQEKKLRADRQAFVELPLESSKENLEAISQAILGRLGKAFAQAQAEHRDHDALAALDLASQYFRNTNSVSQLRVQADNDLRGAYSFSDQPIGTQARDLLKIHMALAAARSALDKLDLDGARSHLEKAKNIVHWSRVKVDVQPIEDAIARKDVSLPALTEALKRSDPEIRENALSLLARMEVPPERQAEVAALVRPLLAEGDQQIRLKVVGILGSLGGRGIPGLMEAHRLEMEDPARQLAATHLSQVDKNLMIPLWMRALEKETNQNIRSAALRNLMFLSLSFPKDSRNLVVSSMEEALSKEEDAYLLLQGVEDLRAAKYGEVEGATLLLPDYKLAILGDETLKRLASRRDNFFLQMGRKAGPFLAKALADDYVEVQSRALEQVRALRLVNDPDVARGVAKLATTSILGSVRMAAIQMISEMRDPPEEAVAVVGSLYSNDTMRLSEREAIGKILIGMGKAKALPVLLEALKNSDRWVKIQAAQDIAKLDSPAVEALEALEEAAKDPHSYLVKKYAQDAIQSIKARTQK